MPLTLSDVRLDPIADRALDQLSESFTVAEENRALVLTSKTGDMKLFLHTLDDLHQWDFVQNKNMRRENNELRQLSLKLCQQREGWKHRALVAEATLLEIETSNNEERQNVRDLRYPALKRYLAKQFHPDFAPGAGIEKVIRNEIFKEIWSEVEHLDRHGVSSPRPLAAQASSTA